MDYQQAPLLGELIGTLANWHISTLSLSCQYTNLLKMPQAVLKTQLAFVQKLKELAPANASLADEIAELLDVSSDSAYRRLRGETAITLDEAVILANHFKIPFSAFTENLDGL